MTLLEVLGIGKVLVRGFTSTQQVVEGATKLVSTVNTLRKYFLEHTASSNSRNNSLSELLSFRSRILLFGGDRHIYQPTARAFGDGRPFPHDYRAVSAFASFFPSDIDVVPNGPLITAISPLDSVVSAGSPVSSRQTAAYLPLVSEDTMNQSGVTRIRSECLPYHFLFGQNSDIEVRSASAGGEVRGKRSHGIFVNNNLGRKPQIWRPRNHVRYVNGHRTLARDFLLVSRLPRNTDGGEILLISGGHGPGTQAFELLFDEHAFSSADLDALLTALRTFRYFQFVLEVSDLHDDGASVVAGKLGLSDLTPQAVPFEPDMFAL